MTCRKTDKRLPMKLALITVMAGCANTAKPNESGVSVTRQKATTSTGASSLATTAVQSMSLATKIPANVAVTSLGLTSNGTLYFGDRAKILSANGVPAQVANMGAQSSSLGNGSAVGNTWITQDLSMASAAKISGRLTIGGHLNNQLVNNSNITGGVTQGAITTQTISRGVDFPTVLGLPVTLEPDRTDSLLPSAIQALSVKPRSKMTLTAGDYFMDNLLVDQDAWLILDMSKGPISIYVRSGLDFKGQIRTVGGSIDQFMIGYFGTQTVLFQGPVQGTVLSPNARLTFGRTSSPHRGSFFAKDIEVQADAQIIFVPYARWLLQNVTVSKTEVCLNEPVDVSVTNNSTIAQASSIYTSINGLPGTHQLMQFPGRAGTRLIKVSVTAPGSKVRSTQLTSVLVKDCGAATKFPRLAFAGNPYHVNTADISLVNAAEMGMTAASYQWSFGDGTSTSGTAGYVSHDYTAALASNQEVSQFTVTATITPAGANPIVAKAVVPVVNTYAVNRNRGLLVPPVTNARALTKSGTEWTGSLSIKNLEAESLGFTKREVELRPCDHHTAPKYVAPATVAVTAAAMTTTSVAVSIPESQASTAYCGAAVRLIGQSTSGKRVVAAAFFDTNPPEYKPITDPSLGAALMTIASQNLLRTDQPISGEQIYRLVREGKLVVAPTALLTYAPKDPSRLDVGDQCYPGETPRKSTTGEPELVCQMVNNGNYQDMFEGTGAYLENAIRGDALMSHFCGDVGVMLSALNPAQYYTHTGLMIGHYEYLRHSTAVEERYATQPNLNLNSTGSWIDEYALKYGWPGSISETIQDAYVGNPQRSDPDGLYFPEFHAFESEITRCGGENSPIVAPRVLKPQPGTGDAGRAPLYAAADMMESDTFPQSHYRFYAYSNAAAAADSYASGGWANASNGTMCASYIWSAFKASNVNLEGGSLEAGDRGDLLLAGETTLPPDGLYRYDAAERADAASAMYTSCYNNAYNGLGFWKRAWTNLAYDNIEDVCGQIVACFAQDQCAKFSGGDYLATVGVAPNTPSPDDNGTIMMTEEEYVGSGTTVAPDDLMNWDVYPYSEELVYRPTWIRPRYRWVAATGTSEIDVTVKNIGTLEPIANATVTLQNAAKESDANGLIHFTAIPVGAGLVNGWKMLPDGHFLRGSKTVTVASGVNSPVELLLMDDFRYRKVVITLNGLIHEDEGSSLYTEDEVPINGDQKTIFLDVSNPSGQWLFRPPCCGGEVTGEADFFVNEDELGGVTLTGNIRLWEGTSCKDNLRTSGPFTNGLYIPRDSTNSLTGISAHYGPDPDNYDFFNLDSIKVENYQETFPNPPLP